MNDYKIEVKELLKKEIVIKAENTEKAFEILKNSYMKENKKEFKDTNLIEVDAKLIEENGEIIVENCNEIEKNCVDLEKLNDKLLDIEYKLNDIIETQEYTNERVDFIANFIENIIEICEFFEETLGENIEFLNKYNFQNNEK